MPTMTTCILKTGTLNSNQATTVFLLLQLNAMLPDLLCFTSLLKASSKPLLPSVFSHGNVGQINY